MNKPISKIFFILISIMMSQLVWSASSTKADSFWDKFDDNSKLTIKHELWQDILDKYLVSNHSSGVNRFKYAQITQADQQQLNQYLTDLQKLDPRRYSKKEQKAYWINLYNALTVKIIIDNYPVKSIKEIGGLFSFGPWDKKVANIAGMEISLNDIEHKILRPIWKDPRLHYAVNCASYSCPNLSSKAYTASNTEELLVKAGQDYVNHKRGVWFEDDELYVSSIYHWYRDDFGGDDTMLIRHLQQYANKSLFDRLSQYQGDIEHDYDWSLNQL